MNSSPADGTKGDILVVDDIPENLHLLYTMLTKSGYEVRRVINGQLALNAVNTDPPELVLLDIMMPDIDGYEVCQRLKSSPISREIPVIFISAKDEVFDKVKAFAVGGVDYITKPFQIEEVVARIRNQLTIVRQKKQLKVQNTLLQQEIKERISREQALQLIVKGTAAKTGTEFFQALVQCLATVLQVRYAIVTEFTDSTKTKVRSLAFWRGEDYGNPMEYEFKNTPCHQVLKNQTCYYPEKVKILFPDDQVLNQLGVESYLGIPLTNSDGDVIGHVAAFDHQPMQDDANRELILRIFAARAGAELERQQYEEALIEAREAALEATRAKSQFLATMSHEIRTPMNGVLGMTELLLKTSLSPQQIDFVKTLHTSGENLLTIINDILDFSKLEVGEMRLDSHEFNLNQILEDLVNLFAHQITTKKLELVLLIDKNVPINLIGDASRLRQILTNLVSNALKFTDQGQVLIQASLENPEVPIISQLKAGGFGGNTVQKQVNNPREQSLLAIPPIDLERLHKLSGGSRKFEQELLQLFLNDAATYLEDIKLAVDSSDFTTLASRAHQLKGASAAIAINGLPTVAAQLEAVAKNYHLEGVPELLNQLYGILEQVKTFVNLSVSPSHPSSILPHPLPPELKHTTIRFAITDTGIGISETDQQKLFQAFSQVDASTTRKYGGTGLGLAISKQLVELMGGEIGVQSRLNQGSTFWFTATFTVAPEKLALDSHLLPLELHTVATIPVPKNLEADGVSFSEVSPPASDWLVKKKLLVVDDNSANRQKVLLAASDWGMEVAGVASGKAALLALRAAVAEGKPFEVALISLQLAKMPGDILGQSILSDATFSGIQLILITSLQESQTAQSLCHQGFTGYLVEPLQESQLKALLMKVFHPHVSSMNPELEKPEMNSDQPLMPNPMSHQKRPLFNSLNSRSDAVSDTVRETVKDSVTVALKVLLVEDTPVNQKVILNQLGILGYQADCVNNGQECLEQLMTHCYDIILMDCQMPMLDGYETTQILRQREMDINKMVGTKTVVIGLTAYAMPGDREKCLAAGMDDYLSKPVTLEQLKMVLEKWGKTQVLLPVARG